MRVKVVFSEAKALLTSFYLGTFIVSLWLSKVFLEERLQIFAFLLVSLCFSAFYFKLFVIDQKYLNPKLGACFAFFAFLLCPSFLQSDQYRYIWDGLVSALGGNPYEFTPSAHPIATSVEWNRWINHSELPTVYPPLAQLLFLVSTYLNPFFWGSLGSEQVVLVGELFSSALVIELGLRLLLASLAFFCLRLRPQLHWELLFFHPAFLFFAMANLHVDALLVLFLMLSSKKLHSKASLLEVSLLSTASMIKFLPLLCLPTLLLRRFRTRGWTALFTGALTAAGTLGVFLLLFPFGDVSPMLTSMQAYKEHWSFFGVFFRVLVDLLELADYPEAFQMARTATFTLGLPALLGTVLYLLRRDYALRLQLCVVLYAFLFFTPTLHPWYFLVPLYFAMPYLRRFWTFWVWPCLWLASKSYYLEYEDPTGIRYLCYLGLALVLLRDFIENQKRRSPCST